jgi:hypothetical protein
LEPRYLRIGGFGLFLGGIVILILMVLYWKLALYEAFLSVITVMFLEGGIRVFEKGGHVYTYRFVKKFKKLGIKNGIPSRKGRELALTEKWLNRLKKAKKSVILTGVTLGGWFNTAWEDLRANLEHILSNVESFEIFVLNPLSEEFKMRERDEIRGGEKLKEITTQRAKTTLENLKQLITDPRLKSYWDENKIKIYIYNGTPVSVVWVDDSIYFATYLPCIADRESPMLVLNAAGEFSHQIITSIKRIRELVKEGTQDVLLIEKVEQIDDIINQLSQRGAKT